MIARGVDMDDIDVGISCRKCGCSHVPAYRSEKIRMRVKRYRQCRNCKHKFITYENYFDEVRNQSLPLGEQPENKG